jgi:hypothetical protein
MTASRHVCSAMIQEPHNFQLTVSTTTWRIEDQQELVGDARVDVSAPFLSCGLPYAWGP